MALTYRKSLITPKSTEKGIQKDLVECSTDGKLLNNQEGNPFVSIDCNGSGQEDVLKEEDKESFEYLEKTASDISSSVRKMMNLTSSKTTIKLDTILKGSKHTVLIH